jgi:hypothetical protein
LSEKTVREPKSADKKQKKSSDHSGRAKDRAPTRRGGQRSADVGRALRSVYDETLREDVPDEFTDLLGKLS